MDNMQLGRALSCTIFDIHTTNTTCRLRYRWPKHNGHNPTTNLPTTRNSRLENGRHLPWCPAASNGVSSRRRIQERSRILSRRLGCVDARWYQAVDVPEGLRHTWTRPKWPSDFVQVYIPGILEESHIFFHAQLIDVLEHPHKCRKSYEIYWD